MPTAVLTPGQTRTSPLGAIIFLDGRASVGTGLTYSWAITGPIGSKVTTVKVVEPGLARVYPDVPGSYVVTLTVTEGLATSTATETIIAHATQVSPLVQRPPNADYLRNLISDFWSLAENTQIFPILWSGYTQTVASDFLRAYQVDADKSIKNIQPLFQRRWLSYSSVLSLPDNYVYLGESQSGADATTDIGELPIVGSVISASEFRLIEGQPSSSAASITIGSETYPVTLASSGTSYRGKFDFSPTFSGLTLSTIAGSRIVFALGQDFSSVAIGDMLTIPKGTNAGSYLVTRTILSLDTTGIPSAAYFEVDRALVRTTSNTYQITPAVSAICNAKPQTLTDTVYVPLASLDPDIYDVTLTGTGVVTRDTLQVETRHVLTELVGKEVILTALGTSTRFRSSVAGILPDSRTFIISPAPSSGQYAYEFASAFSIRDRVLCVEERGHQIRAVKRLSSYWAIQLQDTFEISGRSNLTWRVGPTVEIPILDEANSPELEQDGVCAGDTFYLSVRRVDTEAIALLPCQVTGVAKNKFAFEYGTESLSAGQAGEFSQEEQEAFAYALGTRDVGIQEDAVLTLTEATRIRDDFFTTGEFALRHYNLPIQRDTSLDIDGVFFAELSAATIVRNSRVSALSEEDLALGHRIKSIPALTEYIAPPDTEVATDGNTVQFAKDNTSAVLTREPIRLLENDQFIVEGDFRGLDAATVAGSDVVTLPLARLTQRDVHSGDILRILSGRAENTYYIREVLSDSTVSVSTLSGATPPATEDELRYVVHRRTGGTFIRFVNAGFAPQAPAPTSLWAQFVLFDNAKTVEENFGTLVGFSRELYEDFGVSQGSYDSAVRALMYAWANGPTVSNVETASHIYLAYPVTEAAGRILDIDTEFSTDKGQILLEDVREDGVTGTGLVRQYYYRKPEESLPEFQGIAINPRTGEEFAVGDVVPALQPLTRSVLVEDRLINPEWWVSLRENELVKYHSWQVIADLTTCDSRDLNSLAGFLSEIRPVYTKPILVGVFFLRDEVSSFVSLAQEGTLRINDTPAFDLESAAIIDSYNESSASTRLLDIGTMITRTLFEGDDLTMASGSDVVSSIRGGFTEPITYINESFPDPITTLGTNLVSVGDILWVRTGVNMGRYEISEVISNTELRVQRALDGEGIDYPPRSMDPANFDDAPNCIFQIQRVTTGTLPADELTPSGDTDFRVERLLAADSISVELTPDALFTITGTTATCVVNLEDVGVAIGDIFIFDDQEYAITGVSGGVLTLASAPSISSGPGTILRSE